MQIDDLDLSWADEEGAQGRHRHGSRRAGGSRGGRSGGGGGKRRGRTFLAFFLTLVILGLLGGGGWYGFTKVKGLFAVPDYATGGTGEAQIEIHKGDSATDMAQTLLNADVVKSVKAFTEAAKADSRSKSIEPGIYKMRLKMRAVDALGILVDRKNRVTNTVTIPEGTIAKDIYATMSQKTGIPVAEFEAAAKDLTGLNIPDFWFNRNDNKQAIKSVEGFLFPAQYELPQNPTAKSILAMMVKRFLSETEKLDFVNKAQNERHISPNQVLVTASIAQAEAPKAEDMGKVARVLYNRVYTNFPCNCLGLDSEVNYWFRQQGKPAKPSGQLTPADLNDPTDPYRTHGVPGLPPGPISNPGIEALTGALQPPEGKWLYFVGIDKQGTTKFAETYEEHQKNSELARKNGGMG